MKRYDNDEQMHSALEVFLFDTLTDTNLEFVDAPQEPAFSDLVETKVFTLTMMSPQGPIEFSVNNLPDRVSHLHSLAMACIAPKSGCSPEESKGRLELAVAALQKMRSKLHSA
jgi:hypothetical protein